MDGEVRAFVQDLGVALPAPSRRLHERLDQILTALRERSLPTLLVFDTYEMAGETQNWIEKSLLQCLVRATWLRVVIAGQRVPDSSVAVWTAIANPTLHLIRPSAEDWFDYGKQHRIGLTLTDVETACRLASHKASLLAQLLAPLRS
jgi:hypothetical protein